MEVLEAVNSEQLIEDQKSEKSGDASVEIEMFEEVGVRIGRQREEMQDNLRGGKAQKPVKRASQGS